MVLNAKLSKSILFDHGQCVFLLGKKPADKDL